MAYDLVLGGDGFIGSQLVGALSSSGVQVVSIDRAFRRFSDRPSVIARQMDIVACSESELNDLISGCRVVYNLIWTTMPASAEADPARDVCNNVATAARIFKAATLAGVPVVFTSSGGTVYGEALTVEIVEDHVCRPISAYGTGKRAAEIYADFFYRAYNLDVRILRIANPYGTGQDPRRSHGAVSRFARQAVSGEAIEVWGDGEVVRDYVHVSDAVECIISVAKAPREQLSGNYIFNVGSGRGASLKDVLAIIAAVLERPLDVSFLPGRSIDIRRNVLSIDRAKAVLGWSPRVDLYSGIRKLISELQDTDKL